VIKIARRITLLDAIREANLGLAVVIFPIRRVGTVASVIVGIGGIARRIGGRDPVETCKFTIERTGVVIGAASV